MQQTIDKCITSGFRGLNIPSMYEVFPYHFGSIAKSHSRVAIDRRKLNDNNKHKNQDFNGDHNEHCENGQHGQESIFGKRTTINNEHKMFAWIYYKLALNNMQATTKPIALDCKFCVVENHSDGHFMFDYCSTDCIPIPAILLCI